MNARQDASKMGGHYGKILFRLAASYPHVIDVIMEDVQNAIDIGCRVVQISIDRKRRSFTIRNDGPSATLDSFNQALLNVANSEKSNDKFGRFGIGLISPLGKCESYTFTTLTGKEALRWSFDGKKIYEMADVEIPRQTITQEALLAKDSAQHHVFRWSSEVAVSRYTKDARKSAFTVEDLRKRILANFAVKMRERSIVVWVNDTAESGAPLKPIAIRAHDFAGRPLEEVTIPRGVMGETRLRLFVVPRTDKRRGQVLVGTTDNPFRIPFQTFANHCRSGDLHPEIISAFESGVFEGDLLHSKIKLDANRQRFEEDDHLVQFCMDLWDWFDENGRNHIEEAQDLQRDERFETLGKRLLDALDPLIKANPELASLLSGKKDQGPGKGTSVNGSGNSPKKETSPDGGKGGGSKNPSGEKSSGTKPLKGDTPDPEGKKRVSAQKGPGGLSIVYAEYMMDELWELDLPGRKLIFNTRHPLFVACDKSDRDSLRFQQMIAMSALSLELLPDEEKLSAHRYLEKQVPMMVELLTKSPYYTVGHALKKAST